MRNAPENRVSLSLEWRSTSNSGGGSPNVDKRDAGAVQREYDRRVVGTGLAEVDEDLGDLESVIDSTSTLDKEKLKADVSELRTKVRSTLSRPRQQGVTSERSLIASEARRSPTAGRRQPCFSFSARRRS